MAFISKAQGVGCRADGCMAARIKNDAVINDSPGVPGATPVVFKHLIRIKRLCPDGPLILPFRGNKMEDITQKLKQKQTEEGGLVGGVRIEGVHSGKSSRSGSVSSVGDDKENRKRKKLEEESETEDTTLEEIRRERASLEEFLFNENNKINKNTVKFILNKWSILEGKLQDEILERERISANYQCIKEVKEKTYSQAVRSGSQWCGPTGSMADGALRTSSEVVLLKPVDEKDVRSNDEIKLAVIKHLNGIKTKLKVKNIRHMRQKGIIVEVKSKDDAELIQNIDMNSVGLKVEKPKRTCPSIIIYDVEHDIKVDELKDDFINKNFDNFSLLERMELKQKVEFRHSFKTKDNKLNWIVQLPGRYMNGILSTGRIFIAWRAYRIREFINVTRCFKCYG